MSSSLQVQPVDRQAQVLSYEEDNYEQLGDALNYVGMFLLRPMHYLSEQALHCFTPIHPGEFGNQDSVSSELIVRATLLVLCLLGTVPALAFWGLGGLIDYAGNCFKSHPYTQLTGTAPAKRDPTKTFSTFSLNACMFWGCLPMVFGGVRPARERIERMGNVIRLQNADFVLMQEVSYQPALALWAEISDQYAHGFTRIGSHPWLAMETSLLVLSKYPIIGKPQFLPLPSLSQFKRGLFIIETPHAFICTTHLESGSSDESIAMRRRQLELINRKLETLNKNKPCYLLGDMNIDRASGEYATISKYFINPKEFDQGSDETATCTNLLIDHNWGKRPAGDPDFEHIDYVLMKKGDKHTQSINPTLVSTFDLRSKANGPSDHRGYNTQFTLA